MFDDVKDQSTQANQQDGPPTPSQNTPPKISDMQDAPPGLPVEEVPESKPAEADPQPAVVEDIMADTDPSQGSPEARQFNAAQQETPMQSEGQQAAQARPPMPSVTPQSPPSIPWDDKQDATGAKKKLLMAGIVIVVVALLGIGGYIAYQQFLAGSLPFFNQESTSPIDEDLDNTESESPQDAQEADSDESEDEVPAALPDDVSELRDTDGDGLTDAEEAEYGTDPELPDTDGDGLFDREEVVSWNTDPLNPDTDGDTYLDGEEVNNGYDPLGDGTLDFFGQTN